MIPKGQNQNIEREDVNVETPHKKPRGGELTAEQKEENRALAKERVVVEHSFAGLKRYRIASDVYRNRINETRGSCALTLFLPQNQKSRSQHG